MAGSQKCLMVLALEGEFPREFILTPGALSSQPDRGKDADNTEYFGKDLESGRLNAFRGSFVAYQKGVLCGQSKDRDLLFRSARACYGQSSLDVFQVPLQ